MKIKVQCYSSVTGKNLLHLCCGGVDGAIIDSCHPDWHKGYCFPSKRCHRFFPDGEVFKRAKLAKLLKKDEKDLTHYEKHGKPKVFEKRAYQRCRLVTVTVEG